MENKYYTYCREQLNFTHHTARYKTNLITNYVAWLKANNIPIKKMTYAKLLDYIGYLQHKGTTTYTINYNLRAISQYNDYLIQSGKKINDVAKGVLLKGVKSYQVLYVSEEELQTIYDSFLSYYKAGHHYLYSDKLMLGLIIYQALDQIDIFRLEVQHINFETGTIYIPSGSLKKEARVLPLQAHQILPLKHYIDNHRKPYLNGHREPLSNKLFYPNCEKPERLNDQFKIISKGLKVVVAKTGIKATRLYLLRQSRIAIWLKQYGLRKTQYLAGYRNINSVETFKLNDVADLQDHIKLYHPLNIR